MAVTYRRFLRLKLREDSVGRVPRMGAEQVLRQVEEKGGLDAFARAMIIQDIEAASLAEAESERRSALERMTDAELIRELFRVEASA